MKIMVVPELLRAPVILRSAWLINRAWIPTKLSPISPSISARGTSAATESMTMMSSALEGSACRRSGAPVHRCRAEYEQRVGVDSEPLGQGVERCSTSMNATMPLSD